jgi:hypothetical protein
MARHNDEFGWKRGVGPYSGNYAKFDSPKDKTAIRKMEGSIDADSKHGWSGPVSRGGPPRYPRKSGPITNGGN